MMRYGGFIIMLLIVALAATAPARAQSNPAVSQSALPGADYLGCNSHADCALVGVECGSPQAVNARYVDAYRSMVDKNNQAQCNNIPGEINQLARSAVAVCLQHRCSAYVPNSFMDPNWYFCRADTDCTITRNICGIPQAVSIQHQRDYDAMTKHVQQLAPIPCQKNIDLSKNPALNPTHVRCVEYKCTPAL